MEILSVVGGESHDEDSGVAQHAQAADAAHAAMRVLRFSHAQHVQAVDAAHAAMRVLRFSHLFHDVH